MRRTTIWTTTAFAAVCFCTSMLAGCGDPLEGNTDESKIKVEMPKTEEELKKRIDDVLAFTKRRYLDTQSHAAWQIMHGLLAFPHDLEIVHNGERVNALDWLRGGGNLRGFNLRDTKFGLDSILEGGSKSGQGHDDQWLAVLTQAGLKLDDTIVYRGKKHTFGDMIEAAKHGVRKGAECSWTIIGLAKHVPFDEEWKIKDEEGKQGDDVWDLEDVVNVELEQDLNSSACGGTHRLIGMAMALERYRDHLKQKKLPPKLEGTWKKTHETIRRSINTISEFRQPDGAFSARWLERQSTTNDIAQRISTTGHQLEFLALALTDEELKEPWVVRATVHLCELFEATRNMPVECGALYHAAHALVVYRQRRWGTE